MSAVKIIKHSIKLKHNNNKHLIFLWAFCSVSMAATDGIDLQNPDLVKRAFKPAFQNGEGTFNPVYEGFEYTVEKPSEKDYDYRLYRPASLKASHDFEVIGRFKNDTVAESSREAASVGIEIYQQRNLSNRLATELSVARLEGYFSRTVFSQVVENGKKKTECFSADLRLPAETTFKLSYQSSEKVFSVYYQSDETEVLEWVFVGSFGIAGSGGENGNANWRMRSSENFLIYIYGFSKNMKVYEGEAQIHALAINTGTTE
jgi:hypothetical protein